jgi:hypothetical protein
VHCGTRAYERNTVTYRQAGSMGRLAFGSANTAIGLSVDAALIADARRKVDAKPRETRRQLPSHSRARPTVRLDRLPVPM